MEPGQSWATRPTKCTAPTEGLHLQMLGADVGQGLRPWAEVSAHLGLKMILNPQPRHSMDFSFLVNSRSLPSTGCFKGQLAQGTAVNQRPPICCHLPWDLGQAPVLWATGFAPVNHRGQTG